MLPVSINNGGMSSSGGEPRNGLYYGWVVLAVCLLLITVAFGARLSFGVFFKSLEEDFGWTRALTSSVFSVHMIVGALITVLGGWVTDRYGPKIVFMVMGFSAFIGLALTSRVSELWQIYLSYGVLLAIGIGPTYTVSVSLANRWFEQRRALAVAIVTSGVGLGSILLAPVTSFFITSYGWRTSYVAVGLIALSVMVPCSLLVRKPSREVSDSLYTDRRRSDAVSFSESGDIQGEGFSLMRVVRMRNFVLLLAAYFFIGYCYTIPMTHIVPHALDLNIAPMQAASIISISGFVNIPSRIAMGYVSDRYGRRLAAFISASVMAISFVWLTQSTNLWMLYVFAIAFGASYGGIAPPTAAMVADSFGLSRIGMIAGIMEIGWWSGGAVGPAIAGYIFDTTGSYSIAFWLCAVASLVIVALVLFIQGRKLRSK